MSPYHLYQILKFNEHFEKNINVHAMIFGVHFEFFKFFLTSSIASSIGVVFFLC